jgi:hypothetical protein
VSSSVCVGTVPGNRPGVTVHTTVYRRPVAMWRHVIDSFEFKFDHLNMNLIV